MIENLNPKGALFRAINGHNWSEMEYLTAQLIDEHAYDRDVAVRAAGGKPKSPKQFPRPGKKPQGQLGDRSTRSVEDIVAYLDTLRPKGAP